MAFQRVRPKSMEDLEEIGVTEAKRTKFGFEVKNETFLITTGMNILVFFLNSF